MPFGFDKPVTPKASAPARPDPHPADTRLRKFGFTIHARPKGKQAVWSRDGELYEEDDALTILWEESKGKVTV